MLLDAQDKAAQLFAEIQRKFGGFYEELLDLA